MKHTDLDSDTPLSIKQVTALTGLCPTNDYSLFENEPGVIVIKHPEKMHKRGSRTMRIPHAVFARVMRRITN